MGNFHQPVLLQAVCDSLQIQPGRRYIDATLGGGGHTARILALGGLVLGLDQDPAALAACPDHDRLTKVKANFSNLSQVAQQYGWTDVSGILFDLGVSSHQFDTAARGFSFQKDGPLDMRMDPELAVTAADLVNTLSAKQLTGLLIRFGEERSARSLAEKIISRRPIATTAELSGILPHPDVRRRVFQALRIAVNDELGALSAALPQALTLLTPGGRIIVISFHSLEDRVVKTQFLAWQQSGQGRAETPAPLIPSQEEILANPRAKSSKLRIFTKT
jgi:16S rRNA (cytosine1402-N4)-methyltransferase